MIKRGRCVTTKICGVSCCEGCSEYKNQLCSIQDRKPEGCRVAPHNPMALEPGCSYWFELPDGRRVTPENVYTYPEELRREWLLASIPRSVDE